MAVFSINYDLSAPGRDYAKMAAGIEKVSSDHIHPLESCWLVSTAMNRADIIKVLREHVDSNDRFLVFQVKCDEWVAEGLDTASVNWLRLHAALEAPLAGAALPELWRLNDLTPLPFPPLPPPSLGELAASLASPPFPPPPGLLPLPFPPSPSLGELLAPLAPSPAAPPSLGELIMRHAGLK